MCCRHLTIGKISMNRPNRSPLLSEADTGLASEGRCCGFDYDLQLPRSEATDLAAIFKALANPVRLQILDILSRHSGEVCVCDIESHFDLSQPTISHHLRVLRKAGVLGSEQRGLWVYYYVRPQTLAPLQTLLDRLKQV